MLRRKNKIVGGVLLVAGTATGAGMLALPVSTGMAGFFPSLVLFLIYWCYMTYTAFLMLEVNLWLGEGTNMISMARRTLGRGGRAVSWLIYLFLLYALTTAYIAGSAPIVMDAFQALTGMTIPEWVGAIPLFMIFGLFVYKGMHSVDWVNRLLMIGLVVAYCLLVIFLTPHVDKKLLSHIDMKYALMGVSVVATSFGFHIIIPSLVHYLHSDVAKLKKVLILGSIIPLVVYISWEFLALGIIPIDGVHGLRQGYLDGSNGAHLLTSFLDNAAIAMVARFFSFFAIVTSFLGVSMSLSDFLADGFRIKKTRSGRILLYLMTFIPPLLITLIDPRAFLSALEYAGAFGVVTLLGLLPALMVWSGRYKHQLVQKTTFTTPGGKPMLLLVMAISIAVILLEIAIKTNLLPSPMSS